MKERTDFEEYESGFFYGRFNQLLRLIRKNRVLPIRPGWEQTPDGIVPPPIYDNAQALAARPFQVTKTGDNTVQVKPGKFHSNNDGLWTLPTWESSGFDTDYSPAGTEKLVMKVEIDAATGETTAVTIGWDLDVNHQVPDTVVTISYGTTTAGGGGSPFTIDTEHNNGEIRIDIAEVTVSEEGEITIEQFVDYNILLPWNGDIFYYFT